MEIFVSRAIGFCFFDFFPLFFDVLKWIFFLSDRSRSRLEPFRNDEKMPKKKVEMEIKVDRISKETVLLLKGDNWGKNGEKNETISAKSSDLMAPLKQKTKNFDK